MNKFTILEEMQRMLGNLTNGNDRPEVVSMTPEAIRLYREAIAPRQVVEPFMFNGVVITIDPSQNVPVRMWHTHDFKFEEPK